MRHVPLGFYLFGCGCFMLGACLALAAADGVIAQTWPFLGGGLTLVGYWLCRPALRAGKALIKYQKRQSSAKSAPELPGQDRPS